MHPTIALDNAHIIIDAVFPRPSYRPTAFITVPYPTGSSVCKKMISGDQERRMAISNSSVSCVSRLTRFTVAVIVLFTGFICNTILSGTLTYVAPLIYFCREPAGYFCAASSRRLNANSPVIIPSRMFVETS